MKNQLDAESVNYIQQVLRALVDNFGIADVLYGLAEISADTKVSQQICPECYDDGVGSEKWGGHNPGCSHAKKQ